MNQTSTEIDGVAVVARASAQLPHVNPRMPLGATMSVADVNEVRLADGRTLFECDPCGKRFSTARQTLGHLPSHSPNSHKPQYDERTIRTVLRTVEKFRGQRGYCQLAANELNRIGIKPRRAEKWAANVVSQLYSRYRSEYHVRVKRDARPATVAGRGRGHKAIDSRVTQLVRRIGALALQLVSLEEEFRRLADDVEVALAAPKVDPEVLEKARKWDQMRDLMG